MEELQHAIELMKSNQHAAETRRKYKDAEKYKLSICAL
jgi:hypothetical protein